MCCVLHEHQSSSCCYLHDPSNYPEALAFIVLDEFRFNLHGAFFHEIRKVIFELLGVDNGEIFCAIAGFQQGSQAFKAGYIAAVECFGHKLCFSPSEGGTIHRLGDVVPDVLHIGMPKHPLQSLKSAKAAGVEEQHCEEAAKLMLTDVVPLALFVRISFKVITKEVEVLVKTVNSNLGKISITLSGWAGK